MASDRRHPQYCSHSTVVSV